MKISRRQFMKGIASSSVLLMTNPALVSYASGAKRNLIIIQLRGGMDGLTAVPPLGDPLIKKVRPNLEIEKPISVTTDFGLNPSLRTMSDLWQSGKAAAIHATSIPYTKRSHFDGQDLMQSGGKVPYLEKTGWLGRGIESAGKDGLAISLPMPLILRGSRNDNYYPTQLFLPDREVMEAVHASYKTGSLLSETMQKILDRDIEYTYQRNKSAKALAFKAGTQLADPNGPSIAVFEVDGFDTHAVQGGDQGIQSKKIAEIDDIIHELRRGLGDAFDDSLILTLTEFGRTVEENFATGSEHGYGTAILMAGGLLKKSQVLADWRGLEKANLFEGRDLPATIDSRSIYCSAMACCFRTDFEQLRRDAFWNESLTDYSETLFV